MQQQQEQILLMQRLPGNSTDDSSSECFDSGSETDIGYETDITGANTDMDAAEDNDGDEDYDISNFAELFADNEHSQEYPTRFPSGEGVLLPRVIDNGVDGAMTETTMINDVEPIPTPTSTAPILPADYSGPRGLLRLRVTRSRI